MKKLLPIGSVVLLKNSKKRLMVIGRLQTKVGDNEETLFDYSAYLYPEGNLESGQMFLFNHADIERIYFVGFQDEEGLAYSKRISDYLDNHSK